MGNTEMSSVICHELSIRFTFYFAYFLVQNDLQDTEPNTYSMKQKENVPPSTVEMVTLIYSTLLLWVQYVVLELSLDLFFFSFC